MVQVETAVHINIKPDYSSSNISCPNDDYTSITLDNLKSHLKDLLPEGGNVTLMFLQGVHTLNSKYLGLLDLNSLTVESASSQIATIQYIGQVSVYLRNISTVAIRTIKFSNSGPPSVLKLSLVNSFSLEDTQITGFNISLTPKSKRAGNITANLVNCFFEKSCFRVEKEFYFKQISLSIANCVFNQSKGSAIYIQAKKNSKSKFKAVKISLKKVKITDTQEESSVKINLYSTSTANALIDISHCVLERGELDGVYIKADRRFQHTQITFVNSTVKFYKLSAIQIAYSGRVIKTRIEKCILDNNKAGVWFTINSAFSRNVLTNDTVEVSILQTIVSNSKNVGMLLLGYLKKTMKVNVTDSIITKSGNVGIITRAKNTKIQLVSFQNTTISYNQNGGLRILSKSDCKCSEIFIYNCTIQNNHLTSVVNRVVGPQQSSAALTIWFVQEKTHAVIEKVIFSHNHDRSTHPVIFQVVSAKEIHLKDCEFISNFGSPVQSYFSEITFEGYNVFKQNIALNGGALTLLHSRIIIPDNTQIDFMENHAERVGGAIYVRGLPKSFNIETTERCFYQLPSARNNSEECLAKINSSLNFFNNSANNGGEDIYGAPLKHSCYVSVTEKVKGYEIAKTNIFRFYSLPEEYYSSISSDPQRVCLCDKHGIPQCANVSYIIQEQTRFPGEKFNVSAVLVGDEFGTVSGTIYATLLPNERSLNQQLQEVSFKKCSLLEYSIHARPQPKTLVLTANRVNIDEYADLKEVERIVNDQVRQENAAKHGITPELLSQPIFINITLEDCPVGFKLDARTYSCECSSELLRIGIENCEIRDHTGLIHRHGTIWIMSKSNQVGIVAHENCPYHYCKSESLPLNPTLPDTQCALNHSGILCGGCLANYSLTIGGNRCMFCQNNNGLSLILFFIAAGFLLVFFIKILDLTVTKGTINGLIFYANIAWAYKSILFPPETSMLPFLQFLQVFLAWLNLDFGIETCFVVGLTAYWKSWLQFVFPFYLWMIVGFMILLSRYSTKVTNILGNNTVHVLATLFLLSYAKLVRTIITALGLSVLRYRGHIMSIVWSFDGNLAYFSVEHSFLMFVALFATLLLWLPYVCTLLAVPYLKRKSHLKCLRWINSWKPLYDAYFGPLKDKHHYWIGLLLIIRGGLLLLFTIASTSYPTLTILIMTLTSTLLLLYVSFVENVYKNKFLGLSENFALVNLVFLSSGTLYTSAFARSVIVQISVSLAFGQFVGIVTFHAWSTIKTKCSKKTEINSTVVETHYIERHNSWSEISNQLRESLLEDDEL